MRFLYLFILLISLIGPLLYSFQKRMTYFKKWIAVMMSIALMMVIFIPWDIYFTNRGVWWFNEKYITGIKFWHLPIEEWMFFVAIPFACVFLYEVLNYFFPKDIFQRSSRVVITVLAVLLFSLSILFKQQMYTSVTFFLTSLFLLYTAFLNPHWLGRFLRFYLLSWIPFLLVNGALTGAFTTEAVVNYNPKEIIGIRIFTVPVEDSVYSLLMLLFVIMNYEYLAIPFTQKLKWINE